MRCFTILIVFYFAYIPCEVYANVNTTSKPLKGFCGKRLFLTPYIESGEIEDGRKAARVWPPILNIESYSGFLKIKNDTNATLFFWFFPAEKNRETSPLLLWLQGGPGVPSVYAIFNENGPYIIQKSLSVKKRDHYWSQKLNVIYVDSPVGTGFSYTNSTGYATNEVVVSEYLYSALLQFFKLFPEYRNNNFFVAGESYGGKFAAAVASTIHSHNVFDTFKPEDVKINLHGLAIGSGFVDPLNAMAYGDYLYQHGLIDNKTLQQFHETEAKIVHNLVYDKFEDAFRLFDDLINGDLTPYKSTLFNVTGLTSYFNYLTTYTPENGGTIENWLQRCYNRRRIHVGKQQYVQGTEVEKHLIGTMMRSVTDWLRTLIDNYRVLFYNGQLDLLVPYPLTMNVVDQLNWRGRYTYTSAKRKLWHVNRQLAGYVKSGGNFTDILVRDAGHLVTVDQPLWALDMITKFTNNQTFSD